MKYLQILNAALLVLGAAIGVVLAVVCLLYGFHLESEPRLRAEMPALLTVTALFSALGAAGWIAFFAHRRQWALRWLLQALPALPVIGILLFLLSLGT